MIELLIPLITSNVILVIRELTKMFQARRRKRNGGLQHDKLDRIETRLKIITDRVDKISRRVHMIETQNEVYGLPKRKGHKYD